MVMGLFSCASKDPKREATTQRLQAVLAAYLEATPLQECRRLATADLLPARLVKSQVEPGTVQKLQTLAAAGLVTVRDDTGPLGPVYAADFTPAGRQALVRAQVCFGPLTLMSVDAVEPAGKIGRLEAVTVRAKVVPGNLPTWAKDAGVRGALGLTVNDPTVAHTRTFTGVLTDQGWEIEP